MQVDFIIIGQGVSGTFLSHFLLQKGASIVVFDVQKDNTASRVASGVINPVTGRRVVKTWMIDDILPFAQQSYEQVAKLIGLEKVTASCKIIDFISTEQMLQAFQKRVDEKADYVSLFNSQELKSYFRNTLSVGCISGAYNINLSAFLKYYRSYLKTKKCLYEIPFHWGECSISENGVEFNGIKAKKIFCCDGIASSASPYFSSLPFSFNKGESLIVSIPNLPKAHIYKMHYTLVPSMDDDDLFWLGSNYEWNFQDDSPTPLFRATAENHLNHWLKIPYKIVEHKASVRPANRERRPFVGLHPKYPSIGILNGMGSKGCSLAPFFAHQLVENIYNNHPLDVLADIKRFEKLLI